MTAKEFTKGSIIIGAGNPIDFIALISKGSVKAIFPYGDITLGMGDALGAIDIGTNIHSCTYIALDNTTLLIYPYEILGDLLEIVRDNRDVSLLLTNSIIKQVCDITDLYVLSDFSSDNLYQYLIDSYEDYEVLCRQYGQPPTVLKGLGELAPLSLDDKIEDWQTQYYENVRRLEQPLKAQLFQNNPDICIGFLYKTSLDINHILLLCEEIFSYNKKVSTFLLNEQHLDFFALLIDLYGNISKTTTDRQPAKELIDNLTTQLKANPCIDASFYRNRLLEYTKLLADERAISTAVPDPEEQPAIAEVPVSPDIALSDSLGTILKYADCPAKTSEALRSKIDEYKQVLDKNSDEDNVRELRLGITKLFYEIYYAVFQISLMDKAVPIIIKMFLNFGYLDEELTGRDNAYYLYSIADHYKGDAKHSIYTFYEWLVAIYKGLKDPSRNEFDVDYTAYVHDLKVSGKIAAAAEQQLLRDNAQRTMYELQNMFPVVNKVTFGRITSYCPVLCEQNILKPLASVIAKPPVIIDALNTIRTLDYSAFYRDNIYSNPECNIAKEYISMEILPDIILMPNIGTRGVMWQEIEGRKRATPSRMMFSVFPLTDIKSLLIQLTGHYRWEMCKRVQGARWNDVSDPSLTSDYCDYAQFYRKNNDLSTQAKEQIKTNLLKAKNNYRELFIRDYMIWIMYEGNGSPRLNKVVRSILFNYCPFSLHTREKLNVNPLYTDLVNKYNVKKQQRISHLDNVIKKLSSSGIQIPEEIKKQRDILEK